MLCDEREHVKYAVEATFTGVFTEGSKERWAFYKVYDLEFPSEEELKHLKGLLIPGSKHAAYDSSLSWLESLKKLVRNIYENHTHIRLVGVCFGH